MVAKLSEFELIDPSDADVLSTVNETGKWVDVSTSSLVDLFNLQVARMPDAAAYISEERCITFRELNVQANKLANYLIAGGVGPDIPVGILLERSPEHLVTILGVLKAGGCYLSLDPQCQVEYVRRILMDAQPKLIVSGRCLGERLGVYADRAVYFDDQLFSAEDSHEPRQKVSPEHLACMIYASRPTGSPKGIMVPHRQILNWVHALWERVPFSSDDVVAQKTSASSPIFLKETFAGLLAGVPQVLFADVTARDVPRLIRELEKWRITQLYTFPSEVEEILSASETGYERLQFLRQLFISSEPCTTEVMAKIASTLPRVTAWFIYGCAEMGDITYCDPRKQGDGSGFVPIGRPINNTRVFVLDEDLRKVPVGATGEMYVESFGLARGYHHLPRLTAERFIANPYGILPGSRLYKTGDLARYLSDGSLAFLGRKQDEVKIRGYRVDVRQVERALSRHPDIRDVAVVGQQNGGATRLVAYLVPRSDVAAPIQQIRKYIAECVPSYMVPSSFQLLDTLPRSANGRVDKSRLPEPMAEEDHSASYISPRTETEKVLAGIWSEVLAHDGISAVTVSATHNFFDLGGHSLLAAQMFSRIRRTFKIELPISTLFQSPVLENFAKAVDAATASAVSSAEGLVRVADREQEVPLSYIQQRLWFVDEHMAEQRTSYNIAFACHARGKGLSMAALRGAVNALVARHETLRTTFVVPEGDVNPVQRIADSLWVDVSLHDIEECEIPARMAAHARHVFDLATGPLFKVSVLRVAPDHFVFMVNIHHIICDGWSVGILLRDLREFYAAAETGAVPNLPVLPLQYADYAIWQRKRDLSTSLAYWTRQLEGYEEGIALPYDFARPAGRDWRANVIRQQYPSHLVARLSEISVNNRVTLFVTLMASVAILLNRFTERTDLCLGTTVAGRDHLDLENLIGSFVNILAIRMDLSDNPTVETLLQRTSAQVLAAIDHCEVPFEHVLAALKKRRDNSQIPLVPVMVRYQNFAGGEARDVVDAGGSEIEFGELEFGARTTPNELDLQFVGGETGLEVVVEYAEDLFTERTIRLLIEQHQRVLQTIVDHPEGRLTAFQLMPAIDPEIDRSANKRASTTFSSHTFESAIDLFNSRTKSSPTAIACLGEAGSLTYGEIDRRANRLAHHLMLHGVDREARVALWFQRSPELLIAMLGVLKAGGCCVPLDPDYPRDFAERVLSDVQPTVVISSRTLSPHVSRDIKHVMHLDDALAQCDQDADPCVAIHPEQLVFILNTSGSTGQPKGVMVTHRQILNWLYERWEMVPFAEGEIVAQTTSMALSVSIKELFAGLLAGVTFAFITENVDEDGATFLGQLEGWRITRLHTLPYQLDAILTQLGENKSRLPRLRYMFLTGSTCSIDLIEKLRTALPSCTIWFNYDCTEANNIACSRSDDGFSSTGFLPAGRSIGNSRALVLDDQLKLRPMGVIGEIYVESANTARGYWRQPRTTAEHFIPNPFGGPGARLFRTGDLGRFCEDGVLEVLGPRDFDVKIRGHRVDIRQVEKVLANHRNVLEAAVLGAPDGGGNPHLLAYVAARPNCVLVADDLRHFLSSRLPTYMTPTKYLFVPELARLPNGQFDRVGVASARQTVFDSGYVAPRSETERVVSELWADVLKQGGTGALKIGTSDNFFELGGHSLLAIHLSAKMRRHFGVSVTVRTLYEFPVMEDFAKAVDRVVSHKNLPTTSPLTAEYHPSNVPVLVPLSRGRALPLLFCTHPVGGQTHFYRELAKALDDCACVYALQSEGPREFDTLEALARFYATEIRAAQPHGKYRLLGWCSGGLLTLAISRELGRWGCSVEYVGLIDVKPIPRIAGEDRWAPLIAVTAILGGARGRGFSVAEVNNAWSFLGARGWTWEVFAKEGGRFAIEQLAQHFEIQDAEVSSEYLLSVLRTTKYYLSLLAGFLPDALGPNTYIYQATDQLEGAPIEDDIGRWAATRGGKTQPAEIVQVPGNHYTLLRGENALCLAGRIAQTLGAFDRIAGGKIGALRPPEMGIG